MSITVQPEALLVEVAAQVTLEQLNSHLFTYGLWLPIVPLQSGLTLAQLVARNAGGRYQLRYGTITRYLRALMVNVDEQTIQLGGPTLKRATGYGLHRALVGHTPLPGLKSINWPDQLEAVTLNIRPRPAAQRTIWLMFADWLRASQVAHHLTSSGLNLAALAVQSHAGTPAHPASVLMLAELHGDPAVVERQQQQLVALASRNGDDTAQPIAASQRLSAWRRWSLLADTWSIDQPGTCSVSLPREAVTDFVTAASQIAHRYHGALDIWGDLGCGLLHVQLLQHTRQLLHPAEMQQAMRLIWSLARSVGGASSTETGTSEVDHALRQPLQVQPPTIPHHHGGTVREQVLSQLRQVIYPTHVLTRPADLLCYAADASIAAASGTPMAVVLPNSTAEVSAIVEVAAHYGIPIVTRGAGSGLAGGSTPVADALVLVLTRMQQLQLDALQAVAHAEAGVMTAQVQQAAADQGLWYAPDPSSQSVSTIGGNIACNAGGPRCLKYGVTADYVLGLTAVLADGRVIRVGDGLNAQSPDMGLLQVLIGSEGTLAILTEATLRLLHPPAARRTALAVFDRLDDACQTVEAIMAAGIVPAALELVDDACIGAIEDYMHLGLPRDAGALLLLMVDGEPEAVQAEAAAVLRQVQQGGARSVQQAASAKDETALWRARKAISPALARIRPNKLGEDICVPLPRIATAVRQIKAIATRYDVLIPVFGHAGDGNLHPNILFDRRDPEEVERVWQAAEAIFALSLELGGTLSGEHGIGILKRPFLAKALGASSLEWHYWIKAALDPHNLLNPGKVLPIQEVTKEGGVSSIGSTSG
ncbi:MAG: FAD-binding protein [Chloroflexaceae bacterium]|nr:FAD-binding protein [Chloroflexaceae bacterium]